MSRDRVPDASFLRAIGTAVVLLGIAHLSACHAPERDALGVDLPELRIAGSDRLAEEPWVAHVAVLDEGVKVRLEYEPADGGPRERVLADGEELPPPVGLEGQERMVTVDGPGGCVFRRVAIVLHASPDQPFHETVRRIPTDAGVRMPRLYLAGAGGRALPFLVPLPAPEIEIERLGLALQPKDLVLGLSDGAAVDFRINLPMPNMSSVEF